MTTLLGESGVAMNQPTTLVATLRGEDGNAVSPATVVFEITSPLGTATDYDYPADLVQEIPGTYSLVLSPDVAGTWLVRVETTDPLILIRGSFVCVR